MIEHKSGQGVKTLAQNNQALLAEYIQTIKDIKAQNSHDLDQLTHALKERNGDLKRIKQDNEALKAHVNRHGEDFKKFRSILAELKTKASAGDLTADVIHGPELHTLNKEREKLLFMYKQETQKSDKLESRCQAMSAQIIDRQKKIYQLEGLFSESEKQRQLLKSLLVPVSAKEHSVSSDKLNFKQFVKRVAEMFQNLPNQVPAWLKT